MKLKVVGSNSSGNAYILKSESGHSLLIDCGVHIKKIKAALDYNLRNVTAIVSHCHGDHASSIKQVLECGIAVYASKQTLEAEWVENHYRAFELIAGKTHHIGEFKVKPFEVNHDVHCFGFLIHHQECGLVLFLTDTYYCDYTFPGLNNIIVECNHDQELVFANQPKSLADRIIQSHMNLNTCKAFLLANNLTNVNNIVLIHLSNDNSDADRFQREIHQATGKTVHIAEAGLVIENFNRQPI